MKVIKGGLFVVSTLVDKKDMVYIFFVFAPGSSRNNSTESNVRLIK